MAIAAIQALKAFALLCSIAAIAAAQTEPASQPASNPQAKPTRLDLASAPKPERETLQRLFTASAWPRRAVVGALRLERYACDESRDMLTVLLRDPAWQVRAFAIRTLARRRVPSQPHWFAEESEPRVLRTALRHRYPIDHDRIDRGVRVLSRSNDLQDKMLAVELGATTADADGQLVIATAKQIILKMNRGEAGMLSSRLAAVTGQRGLRRAHQWQNWLIETGRQFAIQPVYLIDESNLPPEPNLLAQLESEAFCNLEEYIGKLGERDVDLAILLDCTASMSGEIAAAQAGIDEMMLFVGDMVASLRVGMVAYRDRRDEFETKLFEFTEDITAARQQVWTLEADGGGDTPEAVFPALKVALSDLAWRPESEKVLVVVGDAPPHIGLGSQCEAMVGNARTKSQLTTHVIQAEGKEVKFFPEIAKAGGGRCVSLDDDDTLMAEVTGLAIGDRYENEFREFFRIYLELCR